MDDLTRKAIVDLTIRRNAVRAGMLFVSAGTLAWRQGWFCLAVATAGEGATHLYLARRDPELLHRRLKPAEAETERGQLPMQRLVALTFAAVLVVAGLDHRFGWSQVSSSVWLGGNLLVAAGLLVIWLAFRANTYASTVVTVEFEQRVVTTGPYAVVRHPMYTGLSVMITGMPLALGSWWALAASTAMVLVLVVRILEEEKFLARNLAGYNEYRARVRHRLAPLVW